MYETHWTGLSGPSWEWEMDLQLFRREMSRYWAATPNQHRLTNRLYRRIRIGAAQREFLGATASDSWRPVTAASVAQNGLAATAPRCFPAESTFRTRPTMFCGVLGRSARARLRMGNTWCAFWTIRGRSSFLLLWCATRFRLERYEFLGVYKYT